MNRYQNLLKIAPHRVAESPHSYSCLTERHVQVMWLEQKFFSNLKTSAGLAIKVISPGLWNADAGPDFLNAHLEIGGTTVKGDVEIHLAEFSWKQHEHHIDPKYNGVVLHVSLWNSKKERILHTQAQDFFHKICLESHLTLPISKILSSIDVELYPYQKFLGSGRCAQELFKKLSAEKASALFTDAALWRLEQKHLFLSAQTCNPRLQGGAGIALALGYKHNSLAFLTLYLWLINQTVEDPEALFALSLAACGFFDSRYALQYSSCDYYQKLKTQLPPIDKMPVLSLNTHKIRPASHPIRKLFFLSKLVSDISHYTLREEFAALWNSSWQSLGKTLTYSQLRERFLQRLPSYTHPYWDVHYSFASQGQNRPISLLGRESRHKILTNTFLPLLIKEINNRRHSEEMRCFSLFYASFPSENTSKTAYLKHRFFGDLPEGRLLKKGHLEQGAYQIHRDFCVHFEASCDGCPFVARYQAFYDA